MAAADVSLVIPTWNGRHLLEASVPSAIEAARCYSSSTGAAIEILVVDDGSTDDTAAWVGARGSEVVRLVRQPANTGFGAACNRGVREARGELVLLLNNDLEIAADAIAPLARHFADAPGLFAVHCRAFDATTGREAGVAQAATFRRGFLRVHERYSPDPDTPPPYRSVFASGGSAMFSRRLFLELGGFDAIFAPYYYEDVELSYRAWKRGYEVRYEPAAAVRHRFSSTIGSLPRARVGRISQRNRILFHWVHLHDGAWWWQHVLWLPIAAVGALLRGRPQVVLGLTDALARMGEARQRRARERREARRTDREVVAAVQRQKKRPA